MATKEKKRRKSRKKKLTVAGEAGEVVGHPVRIEVLRILSDQVASPPQLAEILDVELNHLTYHIRILKEYGCLEVIRKRKRRGATEYFYRAARRAELSDEDWEALSDTDKSKLLVGGLRNFFVEGLSSVNLGNMIRDPNPTVWWKACHYDQRGREDADKELRGHIERLRKIEEESANRMAASEEAPHESTIVGVFGFQRSRDRRPKMDVELAS